MPFVLEELLRIDKVHTFIEIAVNCKRGIAFTLSSGRKIILQSPSLGLRWRLTADAPPPSSTAGIACRSKPASIVADSRCSVYLRPCRFTMSRTVSLTVQG